MSGFDPMQLRDWHGRWTDTGNEGGSPKAPGDGGGSGAISPGEEPRKKEADSGKDQRGVAADDDVFTIIDGKVVRGSRRDEVRLPAGAPDKRYDDEIESLLEWIANARPEVEQSIRLEIERVFAARGDRHGADWLHKLLTRVVRDDPSREEREQILQEAMPLLDRDPSRVGAILGILGLLPGGRGRSFPRRPAPPHRPPGGTLPGHRLLRDNQDESWRQSG